MTKGLLSLVPSAPTSCTRAKVRETGYWWAITDLRNFSHGSLELHELLIMGIEELDGVGEGHREIWGQKGHRSTA